MPWLRIAIEGLLCLSGLLLMWQVLFHRRPWERVRPALSASCVSVIIPARNEAHQIRRLLSSLRSQSLQPYEIVVVDDNSDDHTGEIARQAGATIVVGAPLPAGWNGKSWACWQGACASRGEILLFLDADTWLDPQGLARLAGLYEGCGLLSVQPYHVTQRAYEQLSAFPNIVVMAAIGAFTPLGKRIEPGGAFGPCVLCRREEYFRVGGHRQVGGKLLEDIPLGRLFLRHGLPVRCYAGRGLVAFRMYSRGLRELVEGWSKGMGFGALSVNPLFTILTAAWIAGCFGAFAGVVRVLWSASGTLWWTALVSYAVCALVVGVILRGVGRFKWWAPVLFPIPLCFFGLVMVWSLTQTYLLRRVAWKGRTIRSAG